METESVRSSPLAPDVVSPGPSRSRSRFAIKGDQDFAQLHAPIRLDHDELTPLERTVADRQSGKPPYMPHDPVADQIRTVAHRLSPRGRKTILVGYQATRAVLYT